MIPVDEVIRELRTRLLCLECSSTSAMCRRWYTVLGLRCCVGCTHEPR